MNIPFWGWLGLIVILSITTFGFAFCITTIFAILFFFLGGVVYVYMHLTPEDVEMYREKPSEHDQLGIRKIVEIMCEPPNDLKADRRLTGSQIIDDQLQDILTYLIRDYILTWYNPLSEDREFPYQVRVSAQRVLVTFANRMKEIDWIPYLTTRLVDDAASHLRLYRQARAKMKGGADGGVTVGAGGGHRRIPSGCPSGPPQLETFFFDLELIMEDYHICRDHICLDADKEKVLRVETIQTHLSLREEKTLEKIIQATIFGIHPNDQGVNCTNFLRELIEVLLYLLLPEEDFHCRALTCLLRELCVNTVLVPLLDIMSDPDYINQLIIWLCRDIQVPSEVFLTTLRITDNVEELNATLDLLLKEMATLRSRDSGKEDDTSIKQQLSSMVYVQRIIETRLSKLAEGADIDTADLPTTDYSKLLSAGHKLFMLPLDVILKNNVALSYFIDYMTTISAQAYLFFYLNVEGWRVSAEQQMSDWALQKLQTSAPVERAVDAAAMLDAQLSSPDESLDRMREAAYSIFEQYLSEKATPRLRIDESLVKRLLLRIRTETPTETWFDEVQAAVYEKLQTEEAFLNGFRNNVAYVKLLAELELLKEPVKSEDEDTGSVDELSVGSETASVSSLTLATTSTSTSDHQPGSADSADGNCPATVNVTPASPTHNASQGVECKTGPFTISAEIIETGVVNEKGKTFGIYAMSVTRKYDSGYKENWHIYRRYSDFYELHQKVRDRFIDLGKLKFPGKKTFHNMERRVLEQRMKMLNNYLQTLLNSSVLATHPSLRAMLIYFLEPGEYDKGVTGGQIVKTLDNLLVNPLKAVVGAGVRTLAPDTLLSTVDGVMDGISKVLHVGTRSPRPNTDGEACKVGASIDAETDDNIPMRIMLLLMTEVFELKSRNQWLRRRIVTLLRQIVRTMFGDIVNRRIIDYVFTLTSPQQVADYLRSFKHSFWPHGQKAEPKLPRDEAIRARTRVAAKMTLFSSLSDELKHILGSETSRRGLLSIFHLFQHPVLNRRLLYVLLEGMLSTLFAHDHPLDAIITRLHSGSPRVVAHNQNITRTATRR